MTKTNSRQLENLLKLNDTKKVSGAYLFSGPEGVGKFSAAVDFACLVADIKNKDIVRKGNHPDVIIIRPEIEEKAGKKRQKDISVDQVKDAAEKAKFHPYSARKKVIIITWAEKMTSVAANSILKFIEEPTEDTVIILTANNEELVLGTIKSRCQSVRFSALEESDLRDFLISKYPGKELSEIESCVKLSHGRVDFAKYFCENPDLRKNLENHQEIFRKALRGGTLEGLALSEKLSKNKSSLLEAMDEWIWFLRDFLKKNISQGSDKKVVLKIFSIISELIALKSRLEKENINPRIQTDNFFIQLS